MWQMHGGGKGLQRVLHVVVRVCVVVVGACLYYRVHNECHGIARMVDQVGSFPSAHGIRLVETSGRGKVHNKMPGSVTRIVVLYLPSV